MGGLLRGIEAVFQSAELGLAPMGELRIANDRGAESLAPREPPGGEAKSRFGKCLMMARELSVRELTQT